MPYDVTIVEDKDVSIESANVVEGFPDVGLVGTIASSYIVERLGLPEVAHIESKLFPPIMVLHKGVLTEPLRIFGKDGLLVVTSEVAIPPTAVYPLTEALAEWFTEKRVKTLISLSGVPTQNRMDIESPNVYGIGNSVEAVEILKMNELEVMEEGFIAGIYALLLKECSRRGLPAIALLAQSFLNYPDPGAAASTISALNRILKLNIDVTPLLEKGDEIRVKARDLMRQAQTTMGGMQKASEQQIPLMYR